MERRNAIIAMLIGVIGLMTGKAESEEVKINENIALFGPSSPGSLHFDLDAYTAYTFKCGADIVTLSPAEIMSALKS